MISFVAARRAFVALSVVYAISTGHYSYTARAARCQAEKVKTEYGLDSEKWSLKGLTLPMLA